jgi:hypothetical protein
MIKLKSSFVYSLVNSVFNSAFQTALVVSFGLTAIFWSPLLLAEPYAIQNILQIPIALESATGTPRQADGPAAYFQMNASKFPKAGLLGELSPQGILAQINYSGLFCKDMVLLATTLPPANRLVFGSLNLRKRPFEWTSADRELILTDLAHLIWQRDLEPDEKLILEAGLQDLVDDLRVPKAGDTPLLLTALCSVYASSTSFISLSNYNLMNHSLVNNKSVRDSGACQ